MSGFTKGPWFHHRAAGSHHAMGGYISNTQDFRDSPAICDIRGTERQPHEANARLIAASPTMYESLVKVEELLSFHEGSAKPEFDGAHPTVRINGEDFAILLADIRAALSKAAGEGV